MIRLSGRNTQAPREELPSAALFPLPGLLILGMIMVIAGIVFAGARTSDRMLSWIFAKIRSGSVGDWSMPVHLLYYGWVAIVGVMGVMLTMSELSGVGARQAAELYRQAWHLWDDFRTPIQETMRPDEEPLGYMSCDHRSLRAPVLFERLYLLFLLMGHIMAVGIINELVSTDPYLACQLWLRYGVVVGALSVTAAGWCGTSLGFSVMLLVVTFVGQAVLWAIDPALTGPGIGLPPFALSGILLALALIGVVKNARSDRGVALLVSTNKGLRRCELQGSQVTSWQKADAPLMMLATPFASGVRLQVGSLDGRDKLRPFRVAGDRTGGHIAKVLESKGMRADVQGDDESNGIAGRLGEVPALAWVLLVSIVFLTQRTVLPPLINKLQLATVFDAFKDELQAGQAENMDTALEKLLSANPDLGSAALTRAQIFLDQGKKDEARQLLEQIVVRRAVWQRTPLVAQAKTMLEKLER